jgi:hypothetical protein
MTTAPSSLVNWTIFANNLVGVLRTRDGKPYHIVEVVYKNRSIDKTLPTPTHCETTILITNQIKTFKITFINSPENIRLQIASSTASLGNANYQGALAQLMLDVVRQDFTVEYAMRGGPFAEFISLLQRTLATG